jgi:hypothetical protein
LLWRNRVGRGRASQALKAGELNVVDRTTAKSDARGLSQAATGWPVGQRRIRLGGRLRFWSRAWSLYELADQRTGRLKSPVRFAGSIKGGLDIPAMDVRFTLPGTPDPDV